MRYQLRLPALAIAVDADRLGVRTPRSSPYGGARRRSRPVRRSTLRGRRRRTVPGQPASAGADVMGIDDGTKLTMWTRAATEARVRPLVDGVQRLAQEPDRADRHPDRRLPDQGRRRGRLQRPAGPLLGRRRVHAELDVAGPVPGHHRARSPACPTRTRSPRRTSRRRPGTTSSTACRSSSTCPSGSTTRRCIARPASTRRSRRRRSTSSPTQARAVAKLGERHPRHVLRRQLRRLRRLHLVADRLGRRRAGHERRGHARRCLNSDENKQIYSTFKSLVDDGTVLMPDVQDRDRARRGPATSSRARSASCRGRRRLTGARERHPQARGRRRDADRRHQGRPVDVRRRRQHRHRP